jgi:hypothetical protein
VTGDASMGTVTQVEAQYTLTAEQLNKLVLALSVIGGPEYTDDPMVNYAADAVVVHRCGGQMWPYNEKMYQDDIASRPRTTCSDECKAQKDMPEKADRANWHALACPNHGPACCPADRLD